MVCGAAEGKMVPYDDFINNAGPGEYYDAKHVIITMTDEEVDDLLDQYTVEI